MRKVCIIQNKIVYGGRLDLITQIIGYFNASGIKPVILTNSMVGIKKENIVSKYGKDIEFEVIELRKGRYIHYQELDILLFNIKIKKYLKEFEIVISTNNASILLPQKRIISYIMFPREWRMLIQEFGIHERRGRKKSFFNGRIAFMLKSMQVIYLIILKTLYNFDFPKMVVPVTISEDSRDKLYRIFSKYEGEILLLYPPIKYDPNVKFEIKENIIVTVGRICEDKGQLDQIKLAQRLKDFHFVIMGFVNLKSKYYLSCLDYITKNKVKNVTLLPNVNKIEKVEWLKKAKIFLHTEISCPFGIVIADAINYGCIPVIHNSGGQKDIVPIEHLRYDNFDQCIEVVKEIDNLEKNEQYNIINELLTHIKKFSNDKFLNDFGRIILDVYGGVNER